MHGCSAAWAQVAEIPFPHQAGFMTILRAMLSVSWVEAALGAGMLTAFMRTLNQIGVAVESLLARANTTLSTQLSSRMHSGSADNSETSLHSPPPGLPTLAALCLS
jgi:hypothetical protein